MMAECRKLFDGDMDEMLVLSALGSAAPLGWLWLRITAAAFCSHLPAENNK
jgi:hypothetical protein